MGTPGSMGAVPPQVTSGSPMTPTGAVIQAPQQQFEQSYVENILRLNLGKTGTFYMTYENNSQWNAKIFTGVIEAAGRDHIIISERSTGQRILLLTLNLDYIVFNEPLVYQYPGVVGNPPQGR
nr:spore coat protein GerQ [Paenibacillus cookii]